MREALNLHIWVAMCRISGPNEIGAYKSSLENMTKGGVNRGTGYSCLFMMLLMSGASPGAAALQI